MSEKCRYPTRLEWGTLHPTFLPCNLFTFGLELFLMHLSSISHAFIMHLFFMHFSCIYFLCNSHAFIFHAFISHVILMHFSCNMGAFPTLYTYILGWVKKNTISILTFPVSQIGAPTYIHVFD